MSKKNIKIALLYGGFSKEREISIKTGKAVENALKRLDYSFKVFDPINRENFIKEIVSYKPDLAFIALHGKGGEDGQIQALLEFLNIKYTGCDFKTSAICMDKKLTKKILSTYNIPVPKDYNLENLKLPAVFKPKEEGSSIGVYIVKDKNQLKEVLNKIENLDDYLIEEYIEGRELTVSILNGKVLPIIEIKTQSGFYDFENKYISNETQYLCPAPLTKNLEEKINDISLKCYNYLNCKGAIRVDIILSKDNNPFVLEINTIPGMTDHSLLPKAAAYVGISFDNLVEKIIEGALNEKEN